ncbi:MAG: ComF family protein [Candidatus Omnitrophota bacterium]
MLRQATKALIDLVFPKICLACKDKLKAGSVCGMLCPKCWSKIKKNTPPFCHSCGRHLEKTNFPKNICPQCLKKNLSFDRAFSPCSYEGILKDLIHIFKYNNKPGLSRPLSRLMAEFIREYNLPIGFLDFIVPVPLHDSKLREREFNQAEVLARTISEEFKIELLENVLQRKHMTKSQADLEINERFQNVKGCFRLIKEEKIKGKNILLVDDVLTTGATSSEAAQILKESGAHIVFVMTLAN